ncbi:MAG TPA: NAD(+)/NADH kinase [Polyangiaceae bacterium]|nr:NAD(+)/NADH kinase [Polyangiaceae bacterium]
MTSAKASRTRTPTATKAAEPRIIVVTKRTSYRRLILEERDPRARNLISRKDPSVSSWVRAHREHERTLETVERVLGKSGLPVLWVRRAHALFDTSGASLVIAIGGDGTLLAASHNVDTVPLLGVNSAPNHSVGFFCAARRENFAELFEQALERRLRHVTLTRMKVVVNGRLRSSRVLNEALYAHSSPAATSRYLVELDGLREDQRSSGFWIGPASGSTAAQRSAGGRVMPLSSKQLQLVVREPYAPFDQKYRLLKKQFSPDQTLIVHSKMDDAMLWLDGPNRQIPIRLGDIVEFGVSDMPLTVLGLSSKRTIL